MFFRGKKFRANFLKFARKNFRRPSNHEPRSEQLAHSWNLSQWIADLNLDPLSRFDSYMRAKVRQLYISLFHAYARKNNMWILDHGEALQNADPLQPALGTGLIHCGRW